MPKENIKNIKYRPLSFYNIFAKTECALFHINVNERVDNVYSSDGVLV